MPILAALAALGADELQRWMSARRAAAPVLAIAAVALVVSLGARLPHLRYGQLGEEPNSGRFSSTVWDWPNGHNRLLERAHDVGDLCGLRVDDMFAYWTFGYAALDRHVPLYLVGGPTPPPGAYNYRISVTPTPGAVVIARSGGVVLAKEADTCTPDPAYHRGWKPRFDDR
jgi:hypothetical protein